MTTTTLRAAVIQQQAWPDKQQSFAETERLLQDLYATHQPQLVLLQELHTTHYFCQVEDPALFDLAEPLDGPSAQKLSALKVIVGPVVFFVIFLMCLELIRKILFLLILVLPLLPSWMAQA